MQKAWKIFLNAVPNLLMIALIPVIKNDYLLALASIVIILVAFVCIKPTKKDYINFIFGLVALTFFEYIFVSTGVETFIRNSLFGVMPLWLPLTWAYGFVAIGRGQEILNK